MQDSHDLVDAIAIHGQPRMFAAADDRGDICIVFIEIDADDLVVRHHDIVDSDLFQIEDAQQHATVA